MLLIHHRSDEEDPELMVSCAAAVTPRFTFCSGSPAINPYFVRLWREIHADRPFQLQFELVPEIIELPALAA